MSFQQTIGISTAVEHCTAGCRQVRVVLLVEGHGRALGNAGAMSCSVSYGQKDLQHV